MRKENIDYVLDVLSIPDEESCDIKADDVSYCPEDPHVALVMERLSQVPLAHRPSSIGKLTHWLQRRGCCRLRIKELVTPMALVSAIHAELEREPDDNLVAAMPDFGYLEEAPDEYAVDAARRALAKLRKPSSFFLSMNMLQRVSWLYAEAYGVITATPHDLIQDLKQNQIIRQRIGLDGTQHSAVFYPDAGFTWKSSREVDRFWEVPCLQLRVKGLSYDRSRCNSTTRQSISEWLAKLGCSIAFKGMDAVLTVQPARAEFLAHDLPAVLRLLISIEPAFLLNCQLEPQDISSLLDKNGARIKALQASHQLRLIISGQEIGGWLSPDVLPKDLNCASLRGLGQTLKRQMCALKRLLKSSLKHGANALQHSPTNATHVETSHEADLVEVVVVTCSGEEVMRKKFLRSTPAVTLRNQLEQAFTGKRVRILLDEKILLDRETFEQLASQVQLLHVQVVFAEKTAWHDLLEKKSQLKKQLSKCRWQSARLKSELQEALKHKDKSRTRSVRDARGRWIMQQDFLYREIGEISKELTLHGDLRVVSSADA